MLKLLRVTIMDWFFFNKHKILVKLDRNQIMIPDEPLKWVGAVKRVFSLGASEENICMVADLVEPPSSLPTGYAYIGLNKFFNVMEANSFRLVGQAYQIMQWLQANEFCAKCGHPLKHDGFITNRSIKCTHCQTVYRPRISPAVIVAVVHSKYESQDSKLLLASNINFPNRFYSMLAGFVEPGETLEECVHREIKEETGIQVCNIRYFGSQPWPFPDSLMIGFTAEYAGGELVVDETELLSAGWFTYAELPKNIPNEKTIAGQLIRWFIAQCTKT